ncbi:MAG: MBL fold metallo-hydrolase [Lachnospiraceae bacterium]|nr:MBL fold metallo-hydrolase [Lachnospiraceae bacterium]
MKIASLVLGMTQTNTYYLHLQDSKEVLVVDPADRGDYIYERITSQGLRVAAVLLTHGHFDHILGCQKLKELSGAPVYAFEEEREVLESDRLNVSREVGRSFTMKADVYLKEDEEVTLAGMTFRLVATPGHTKGSCCFYFEEEQVLISGDTLFQGSVGRTDLPTGSGGTLYRSLKEKLMCLPEETKVYPGHGDSTTIGEEKRYNPYCA